MSHDAFFDLPLMAQQWPSGGVQTHCKTNIILTIRARRACQERPQEGPRRATYVKLYWFYNVLDCRHWAFVRPSMGGQKNTSWPTRAPKGAIKSAQTVCFKLFLTFFRVPKRGRPGRTHARTDGRTDAGSAPDPPPQRTQEKNTPFGAHPLTPI